MSSPTHNAQRNVIAESPEGQKRIDGDTRTNEERYAVADAHGLHVFQNEADDWEIWLNTEVSDYDGLILGMGPTRQAALEQAVSVLELVESILQGPPPCRTNQ